MTMPPTDNNSAAAESLGPEQFKQLYVDYNGMVRRVIYRMVGHRDLDDLVQDTFVKAFASRENFGGQSTAKTWLTKIAMNAAIDSGRKSVVRHGTVAVEDVDVAGSRTPDPALAIAIDQAVGALPAEWRAPFVLVVLEGFTAAEAATALGVKAGTVRSRVHRAREQVRSSLTAERSKTSPSAPSAKAVPVKLTPLKPERESSS